MPSAIGTDNGIFVAEETDIPLVSFGFSNTSCSADQTWNRYKQSSLALS